MNTQKYQEKEFQGQWMVARVLHSAPPVHEQFVIKIGMPEQISEHEWRCPYYASLEKQDSKGEVVYVLGNYSYEVLMDAILEVKKCLHKSGLTLTWLGTEPINEKDLKILEFIARLGQKTERTSKRRSKNDEYIAGLEPKRRFRYDLVKVCGIFESIAKQYPSASSEYKAIQLAHKTIWFIFSTGKTAAFQEYFKRSSKLSKEQIRVLRDYGLKP